ncbi:hypothetical protein Ahy_Scaffold7g108327 [Arachis hypogaea]|uniref:FAR1 domain-containing protein n=1 Tax=Arachis hypogaea TaxID=3818 RepID=A0A444WNM1_ARAHY|nr:hypothetical protein Ahy_Scaffold7g108327 [Arachis hypogaea]
MEFTKGNKGCDTMEGSQREEGCRPDEELDDACGGDSMNGVSDEYPSDYAYVFGLSEQDIIRKVFRSEERAYDFYSKFGRCHGFGVRKGDYGKDEEGNLIRRRFFCNRAGLRDEKHLNRLDRKRGHRPETRTNCLAKLSIYLDRENSTWKVRKVILDHNHELTPRRMVHMIPKFRRISDAAKANIDGMRGYGVSTSKILGYMAGVAGGYSLLGFTKKDAYNYIDHMRRAKVVNGDSNAAIVDDFELEWEEASEKFGLHKKCWANQMYEKRHMWCNAYLRGKFCAGYRTTSRCEGINSHIKGFLNSRHSILELVQNLELVVREYRNNELVAQFNSIYSTPVLTTCLDPIERCAADVYTRAIFVLVKKEIDGVGAVNFVSKRRVSTTMV